MYEFVKNFYDEYKTEDLFCNASEDQISDLIEVFGTNVDKIIDFYRYYQPNNIPMLDSYVRLLGIDGILMENLNGEPGKYLSRYGICVFAVTVGGNVLCVDTNETLSGDASVVIADSCFCSYNEHFDCVEIGRIPKHIEDDCSGKGIVELNYLNAKKCLTKIESSFLTFMEKLSINEYEDIEEFLE